MPDPGWFPRTNSKEKRGKRRERATLSQFDHPEKIAVTWFSRSQKAILLYTYLTSAMISSGSRIPKWLLLLSFDSARTQPIILCHKIEARSWSISPSNDLELWPFELPLIAGFSKHILATPSFGSKDVMFQTKENFRRPKLFDRSIVFV